jgi:hypothetical protein
MSWGSPFGLIGYALVMIGLWHLIVVWRPDLLGGRIEDYYDYLSSMRSKEVRQRRRANRRKNRGLPVVWDAVPLLVGLWLVTTGR